MLEIPPPLWLKFSASPAVKSISVLLGMFVISATTAAFCTRLVPTFVLPLPGVLTVNSTRSPFTRPPGERILLGCTAPLITATAEEVLVGKVKVKLLSGKL